MFENTVALTKNHTLVQWSHAGKPIIYPLKSQLPDESRGGIPLCIPQFSIQQRPIIGCDLPLHGLLMHSDHGEVSHNSETDTITAISEFSATGSFDWNHTVTTKVTETSNSLSYHITIARATDCSNQNEMPISLGFHPYFATHGDDFSFTIGDKTFSKVTLPDNIVDSKFVNNTTNEPAVLQTKFHRITMTSTGFDEYCLWTDDISKYICIEPIWQYREFGLPQTGLLPGEEKVVTVSLRADLI